MNQRNNSVNTPNSLSENKKPSVEVKKPVLKPSPEIRQAFQGSEDQNKSDQSPLEKLQLTKEKPTKTLSTSTKVFKQPLAQKLVYPNSASKKPSLHTKTRPSLESKPCLKPSLHTKPSLRPSLHTNPSLRPSLRTNPSLRPSLVSKYIPQPPSRLAQRLLVSKQQGLLLSQVRLRVFKSSQWYCGCSVNIP